METAEDPLVGERESLVGLAAGSEAAEAGARPGRSGYVSAPPPPPPPPPSLH
eukprot:COSAG04_NODE_1059_length_8523_cov_2.419853_3_plen_52_part_00